MKEKSDEISRVIFPPQIYKFLEYLDRNNVDKTVLDCGAGGKKPPLALFFIHGYKSYGLDISGSRIRRAKIFSSTHNMECQIVKADMRRIPFADETFGCVFSWNSSIHLTKEDTEKTVCEMLRVLKTGGLLYVNFLWNNVVDMNLGEERKPGEFWKKNNIVHSCFSEDEANRFFEKCEILFKQKRIFERKRGTRKQTVAYLDYIVKKY